MSQTKVDNDKRLAAIWDEVERKMAEQQAEIQAKVEREAAEREAQIQADMLNAPPFD